MERQEALNKISAIVGQDLRRLADAYEVTVFKDGKKNKGWAGHVIERHLGLPLNCAQSPNFGSGELKTISMKHCPDGRLCIKETMAITMIDPYHVARTDFEHSHLLAKLQKAVIAARVWESQAEPSSLLYAVKTFDLSDPEIFKQVREDYDLVRNTILSSGFSALSGSMGKFVQPRTKGPGHGSTTRAFYARVPFLTKIFLDS